MLVGRASAREPKVTTKVLIRRGDDGFFVASCPSLKSCWSQGKTREEALANIREAITLYPEPRAKVSLKHARQIAAPARLLTSRPSTSSRSSNSAALRRLVRNSARRCSSASRSLFLKFSPLSCSFTHPFRANPRRCSRAVHSATQMPRANPASATCTRRPPSSREISIQRMLFIQFCASKRLAGKCQYCNLLRSVRRLLPSSQPIDRFGPSPALCRVRTPTVVQQQILVIT